MSISLKERLQMICENDKLNIRSQCKLLGINGSTLFYQTCGSKEDTTLANEILDIWNLMPFYGYRRITKELHSRGYEINHKKVLRLLQAMDIQALYPKRKIKTKGNNIAKYP